MQFSLRSAIRIRRTYCQWGAHQRLPVVAAARFRTVPELTKWLNNHGVDTSLWGKGTAKTVDDLLEEHMRQESVLEGAGGQALRIVRVLSLHVINDHGLVLYEEEQLLPDGRARKRNVPVSEKLIGDEDWGAAISRAVQEELGSALDPGPPEITVLSDTYRQIEEYAGSMSYPGLTTKYIFDRINAKVYGLPQEPFETYETRPTGRLITRWVWKVPDSEEEGASAQSDTEAPA